MRPITIGPRNAEAATGVSWRWIRDHAPELGITIIQVDGKRVVLASELLAALERRARPETDEPQVDNDELAEMRRRIARVS
jgi:hypothetical protein